MASMETRAMLARIRVLEDELADDRQAVIHHLERVESLLKEQTSIGTARKRAASDRAYGHPSRASTLASEFGLVLLILLFANVQYGLVWLLTLLIVCAIGYYLVNRKPKIQRVQAIGASEAALPSNIEDPHAPTAENRPATTGLGDPRLSTSETTEANAGLDGDLAEVDALTEILDHFSRKPERPPDEELLRALREEGFGGRVWGNLSNELAVFGYNVVQNWLAMEEFRNWMRRSDKPSDLQVRRLSGDDRDEIAFETVAIAVSKFKNGILDKALPFDRPSLRVSFIELCFEHLPIVYRRWRYEAGFLSTDTLDESEAEAIIDSSPEGDPAQLVEAQDELARLLSSLDLRLQVILQLTAEGYSLHEVAHMLGVSSRSVHRALSRYRQRLEKNEEGDAGAS